jgi:hypothetical protein
MAIPHPSISGLMELKNARPQVSVGFSQMFPSIDSGRNISNIYSNIISKSYEV